MFTLISVVWPQQRSKAWLQKWNLKVYQICGYCKFLQKTVNILQNVFAWNVRLMFVDVWNRSEIFWKSKCSQGVKTDYSDRISKSTKFANIVNFYWKLWNIWQNVFAWNVSIMQVDVWKRSEVFRKSNISQRVKPDYKNGISNSNKFAENI